MSNEETTTATTPVAVAVYVAAPDAERTVIVEQVVEQIAQQVAAATPPPAPKKFFDIQSDDLGSSKSLCPPPDDGEVIIWRATAASRRAKGFRDLKCIVFDYSGKKWWDCVTNRWRTDKFDTTPQTIDAALTWSSPYGTYVFYVRVMPEDPNKPKRKCRIDLYLTTVEIEMLKLAPNNATFRARVMAAMEEMPPVEADTFDKLKDWIEFNFPKESLLKKPVAPPQTRVLSVPIEGQIQEWGRCKYCITKGVDGAQNLDEARVRQWIADQSTEDEVLDCIDTFLRDRAENHVVNTDESFEDYDSSESDTDINYDRERIREFIRGIAAAALPPDEYNDFIAEQ